MRWTANMTSIAPHTIRRDRNECALRWCCGPLLQNERVSETCNSFAVFFFFIFIFICFLFLLILCLGGPWH